MKHTDIPCDGRPSRSKRAGKHRKIKLPLRDRAAISPTQFASLFGREAVWCYRRIWSGCVKVISDNGRMMIPQSEVARLLESAQPYKRREGEVKAVGQ